MVEISATEFARNLSRILDRMAHGGGEVIIVRNNHPVAKLSPGAPRMTALEAMADLHRTLGDEEGGAWLRDSRGAEAPLDREMSDPWA